MGLIILQMGGILLCVVTPGKHFKTRRMVGFMCEALCSKLIRAKVSAMSPRFTASCAVSQTWRGACKRRLDAMGPLGHVLGGDARAAGTGSMPSSTRGTTSICRRGTRSVERKSLSGEVNMRSYFDRWKALQGM